MAHRESEQKAEAYIKLLQDAINSEDQDDDEVIDIASQVLNFMPDDKDVLLCRAVAYIKTSPPQFQNALTDLENVPNAQFEKCLCLYGLHKYDEALKFIREIPADKKKDDRFKLLEEQILLSLDDATELNKFYSSIDSSKASPNEMKNITCGYYITQNVEKALQYLAETPKPKKGCLYNLACLLVLTKNYQKANELVESGLKRCEKSPMFYQLFLILKAEIASDYENNVEKSTEIYNSILNNEKSHPYCLQIAASNLSSLTIETNVHQAKKLMSYYDNNDKYVGYRSTEIESYLINRFLILHKIGQPNKVKALIEFAKKQNKIDPLIPESFERTVDSSNSIVTKYSPLFEAQNLISQSKYSEAAEALLKSNELSQTPRGITVISELYLAAQKPEEAIEFLKKSESNKNLVEAEFLDFASRFAYQAESYQQGVKWAEKLVKVTGNSPRSIAIHSMLLSETDIELAERYANRIKIQVANDEELDEIEEKPTEAYGTIGSELTVVPSDEDLASSLFSGKDGKKDRKKMEQNMSPEKIKKMKEKKRRRRRLQKPQNYDPQRHMDPERWIKLKKRSGRKKSAKKVTPQQQSQPQQQNQPPPQPKKQNKKGRRKGGW